MSPSFLVKILCYACRSFIVTLASSAIICASRCLILKWTLKIITGDASVTVKGLHA